MLIKLGIKDNDYVSAVCNVCNSVHIYHDIGWIIDCQNMYESTALALYELQYKISPECSQQSVFNIAHIIQNKDSERAIRLFKSIADKDIDAVCMLGKLLKNSNSVEALEWLNKGRDRQDVKCIYQLGNMYYYGIGIEIDQFKALSYYVEAANKLHYNSIKKVIMYYDKGIAGITRSNDKQVEWFEKIPEKERTRIDKFNLAFYYLRHSNSTEKQCQGLQIMNELVAKYEDRDAMYMIGEAYEKSKAKLVRNDKIMKEWFKRSADLKDYDSCVKMMRYSTNKEHAIYFEKAIRIRNDENWEYNLHPHPGYSDQVKINVEVGALKKIFQELEDTKMKLEEYDMRPPLIGGKLFREARERFNKINKY